METSLGDRRIGDRSMLLAVKRKSQRRRFNSKPTKEGKAEESEVYRGMNEWQLLWWWEIPGAQHHKSLIVSALWTIHVSLEGMVTGCVYLHIECAILHFVSG